MKEKKSEKMHEMAKHIVEKAKKTAERIYGRMRQGNLRNFCVKYGYYCGLALLLVLLGTASQAYRSRPVEETVHDRDIPVEVSYVITPAPTETPAPVMEEAHPRYIWPVEGSVEVPFSADMPVWNESLAQWRTHPAIDIRANAGQSVVACGDGVVKDAYEDALWGNVIVIEHRDGCQSLYAGLNTLKLVEVGESVSSGDVISTIGNSAIVENGMDWHLHFEFMDENGMNVDFEKYLKILEAQEKDN